MNRKLLLTYFFLLVIFLFSILIKLRKREGFTTSVVVPISSNLELTSDNYDTIIFVLNSFIPSLTLLQINSIIANDNISDIYQLAEVVNINTINTASLSISQSNANNNNNTVSIVSNNQQNVNIPNYKINNKIKAFSQLIKIPTLDNTTIIRLVNEHDVSNIDDLFDDGNINYDTLGLSNLQILGINYYFGKQNIELPYYQFIKYLELDDSFRQFETSVIRSRLNPVYTLRPAMRRNRQAVINILEDESVNQNLIDINTILVVFKYHSFINLSNIISINEIVRNNPPSLNNDLEQIFINIISGIDLDRYNNNNSVEYILIKFGLRRIFDRKLTEFRNRNELTYGKKLFNVPIFKEKTKFEKLKDTQYKNVKDTEYKTINKLNREAMSFQDNVANLKYKNILNITENFSKNILNVIDELINLYTISKDDIKNTEQPTTQSSVTNPALFTCVNVDYLVNENMFKKYLFYFKNTIVILTKNERLFYTGMLLIMVAICVNFIELSS